MKRLMWVLCLVWLAGAAAEVVLYSGPRDGVRIEKIPSGYFIAHSEAEKHYQKGEYAEMFGILHARAANGDIEAQNRLAEIYRNGLPAVPEQAKIWADKAAQSRYEQAFKLAKEGRHRDAAELYRPAAEHGHARAQTGLGILLAGDDAAKPSAPTQAVPQDLKAAVMWLEKAAAQNDAQAYTVLGLLYEQGKGVPQDYARALALHRQAASAPEIKELPLIRAGAYFNMGLFYMNGWGVEKDLVRAAQNMTTAADLGNPVAISHLRKILSQMRQQSQGAQP